MEAAIEALIYPAERKGHLEELTPKLNSDRNTDQLEDVVGVAA